ncbi:MAG TPA: competence/damage-inducible protein A [Acidimicrobiales bacterium]|nr:competence/damage-inducible protein A [Acidimicrobiales bacterium]
MIVEVVAVGTELLLGQIVDTNSAWLGERLARAGIDCHFQVKVGDNHARIVAAIRGALDRADGVICCGGLGPTQDDITREAIAEVMGVPLVRSDELVGRISRLFTSRGREMAASNLRQADVPEGATVIPQVAGTAPGLICPVGSKVVYAVPGVPHEMKEMVERAVVPDLTRRAGAVSTIVSRTLRTWGLAESRVAEMLAGRIQALEAGTPGGAGPRDRPTIAFLASGIEGIKVRLTAKAASPLAAAEMLDAEEAEVRAVLGDTVFGVDDETMESAVGRLLTDRSLTLGVAESLTGGMVGARLTAVAGASAWFRGSVVSYSSEVKRSLLGVGEGPVVSPEAAEQMAAGARRVLGADVGLGITGVAGPAEADGQPVGTVWVGLALGGEDPFSRRLRLPGPRDVVRQLAVISSLDVVRRRLTAG